MATILTGKHLAKRSRHMALGAAFAIAAGAIPSASTALEIDLGVAGVDVGLEDGLEIGVNIGGENGVDVGVGLGPEDGLDVDLGVGGDEGLNLGVGVGGDEGVDVDLGLGSTGEDVTPDDGDTSGGDEGWTDDGVVPVVPSSKDIRPAQAAECRTTGNSEAYNGFLVFDRNGRAMGVVHGATVGNDLHLRSVTFATSKNFYKPVTCLTLSLQAVKLGQAAMALPYSSNEVVKLIAQTQ